MADILTGFNAELSKIVPKNIQDFTSSGLITAVSLNIDTNSAESDMVLLFDLGNKNDRSKTVDEIVEFESVKNIFGHGMATLEKLNEMGIIKKEGEKGIIYLKRMLEEVESRIVSISIKSNFPKELLNDMIKVHINKSAGRKEGKLQYYMEVLLNHPSIWQKVFGSISIRDIVFTINIENMTGLISENMPPNMARHLRYATASIMSDKASVKTRYNQMVKEYAGGPWQLVIATGSRITHLTTIEIPKQILSLISIDPTDQFEILDVKPIPHMATLDTMPLPMYFPSVVRIAIRTRLEVGELTKKGRIEIDLAELSKMIAQAIKEIQSIGRGMKDKDLQEFARKIEEEMPSQSTQDFHDGDLVFD